MRSRRTRPHAHAGKILNRRGLTRMLGRPDAENKLTSHLMTHSHYKISEEMRQEDLPRHRVFRPLPRSRAAAGCSEGAACQGPRRLYGGFREPGRGLQRLRPGRTRNGFPGHAPPGVNGPYLSSSPPSFRRFVAASRATGPTTKASGGGPRDFFPQPLPFILSRDDSPPSAVARCATPGLSVLSTTRTSIS